MNKIKKVVVAVTGASGSIYAKRLLDRLMELKGQYQEVHLVLSETAMEIWRHELNGNSFQEYNLPIHSKKDFNAPFASGSAGFTHMLVCPCSMGTLARIANGISDDLITRAADVMLKEKRMLLVVPRETPYSLIHIQNMEKLSLAGGIILPATPSFYSRPATILQVIDTVIDRILAHCGFEFEGFRWGSSV